MKIIADTNTFLAVILSEPERDTLITLTAGNDLIAPDVLPFEIGNALSAMVKRKRLSPSEALQAWDAIQNIPVDLRAIDIRNALEVASSFSIYAYDAYFLVCAENLRSPLLTLDKRMGDAAGEMGIRVLEVER